MKLPLLAASALALTAAACGPKTPPARAALDCPLTQGSLTRSSASPDGKVCTYADRDGAQVTLQLVALTGGLDTTLSGIETALLANRAAPSPEAAKGAGPAKADPQARADADKAVREAQQDSGVAPAHAEGRGEDAVNVEMDHGQALVTESADGTTRVNLAGIHIVANDGDDSARVQVGPIRVEAGGDAATIRIRRDVRLRGEALNPDKRGVRATFIYTGHDLPDGYRFVGYEAGGPKAGPITVAIVKSRVDEDSTGRVASDVRRLVRKNGGV
jgi:hypothetical protein